jgi:hypothetical protein
MEHRGHISLCQIVRNSFKRCFLSYITILTSKNRCSHCRFEKLRFTYFHWTEVVQ